MNAPKELTEIFLMKYDDASWHFDSTPEYLEEEERWAVAAAHIGVYFKWCLIQGWAGELHTADDSANRAIESVRAGGMTGAEFLIDECDCRLTDEDLNDEGNAFSAYYFEKKYPEDLESVARDKILSAPETEYDFAGLSRLIDQQYEDWFTEHPLVAPPRVVPSASATETVRADETSPQVDDLSDKPWWKIW